MTWWRARTLPSARRSSALTCSATTGRSAAKIARLVAASLNVFDHHAWKSLNLSLCGSL